MSQLDLSIFYPHLVNLILIFYIIIHYLKNILSNFLYNNNARLISNDSKADLENPSVTDSNLIIKRILKL